jgi:hypothetical protein
MPCSDVARPLQHPGNRCARRCMSLDGQLGSTEVTISARASARFSNAASRYSGAVDGIPRSSGRLSPRLRRRKAGLEETRLLWRVAPDAGRIRLASGVVSQIKVGSVTAICAAAKTEGNANPSTELMIRIRLGVDVDGRPLVECPVIMQNGPTARIVAKPYLDGLLVWIVSREPLVGVGRDARAARSRWRCRGSRLCHRLHHCSSCSWWARAASATYTTLSCYPLPPPRFVPRVAGTTVSGRPHR